MGWPQPNGTGEPKVVFVCKEPMHFSDLACVCVCVSVYCVNAGRLEQSSLERLTLSSNGLAGLNMQVGLLKHLRKLDLSQNCISQIPESIANLTSLKVVRRNSLF